MTTPTSYGCLLEDPPPGAWEFAPRATEISTRGHLRLPTKTQDQLSLGSCVAQTYKKMLEVIDGRGVMLSALGIYLDVRDFSGFPPGKDSGAFPEAGARAMASRGAGSEALWPYDVDRFSEQYPADYAAQAQDHRVTAWYRARTSLQAKSALDGGLPVGMAFDVPPAFDDVGSDGLWRDTGGSTGMGHMTCIVAWDDTVVVRGYPAGAFYSLNWWSIEAGWGAPVPGHPHFNSCGFWIPYAAFDPGGRVKDAIVISDFDSLPGQIPDSLLEPRPMTVAARPKRKAKAKRKKKGRA